ncbi:T6SS effector BTH_I2691 family protein [Variovorax robiniae]|uniref:T6SS effector BTH_I2691 family protein n=1 Tax=Variovorax robiniae TaxID=1836199 RepID=A0ABU8XAT9_9BURK
MSKEECKRCDNKAGLSILLVRPSAIAKDPDFAPDDAARMQTHDDSVRALGLPSLEKSRHVLRMLRKGGFVYAYYTKRPPQLRRSWQAFRVQGSGALIPESQIVWADTKAEFSCSRKDSHPHDVRTLCIELPEDDPGSAGPVWIGFSMNWWDDKLRNTIQANPAASGMVCIDPLAELGGVKNAFKAEAGKMEEYIADFGLRSFRHGSSKKFCKLPDGGTEPATPFYNAVADKTCGQAKSLQEVMQRQAAKHPLTKAKEFVLAIPDPVGFVADLNGIRVAIDRFHKQQWLANDDWVRSETCYSTLEGMRKAIMAAGVRQAPEWATRASEKQWKSLQGRDVPYEWAPNPDGTYASDGSRNGRMRPIGPNAVAIRKRIERDGLAIGKRNWGKFTAELNMGKFEAWPAKRDQIDRMFADSLATYEADWMAALDRDATRDYFKFGFDENDEGKLTACVEAGYVYCRESDLMHFPQPQAIKHTARWTGIILDSDLTDPKAVALRAFFGNQRSILTKVKAILVGNADRRATEAKDGQNEITDIRDKTYDLLKGALSHELGARFNWLHPRLMALSAGGLAASAAGALQTISILSGGKAAPDAPMARKYLGILGGLTLAQQQLDRVSEATKPGGNKALLSTMLYIRTTVDEATAMRVLNGYVPKDQLGNSVVVSRGGIVELHLITDVKTALEINEGKIKVDQVPGARVEVARATGGKADQSLDELQAQTKSLPVKQALTPAQVAQVMERQAVAKELRLTSVEGRVAMGAMLVQALGLYQGVPQLLGELNKSERDQDKIEDAAIGVLDSMGGFVGATCEGLAAVYKSSLLMKQGGAQLVEISTELTVLRTAAALTGMLGAAITVYSMGKKADAAQVEGDSQSAFGYRLSSQMGRALLATGGIAAVDAVAQKVASRTIARLVLLRVAGTVATEAAVAGAAGTVASVVSGLGLVLMLVAVGGYIYGVVNERDSHQRWAGRCYFGKDTDKRFETARAEEGWLMAIEYEADAQEDVRRKSQQYPAPSRPDWGMGTML